MSHTTPNLTESSQSEIRKHVKVYTYPSNYTNSFIYMEYRAPRLQNEGCYYIFNDNGYLLVFVPDISLTRRRMRVTGKGWQKLLLPTHYVV